MSEGIGAQDSVIRRGDGASPETYTVIEEVVDINGPNGSITIIDMTHLSSTSREKKAGLPDEGKMTLTCNYYGAEQQDALRVDRKDKTKRNFEVEYPTEPSPTKFRFQAFVMTWSLAAKVDDKVPLSIELEITGDITKV